MMLEIMTFESPRILIAGLAIFIAGLVRGFAGFGSGMIMVATLVSLYPPVIALPVVLLTELVLSLILLPTVWQDIKWPLIWPMVITAAVTSPLGIFVLDTLSEQSARILVSMIILSFVVSLLLQRPRTRLAGRGDAIRAGGLSGLMGGVAGMTGPPVVALLLRLPMPPREVRATMIGYFVIIDAWLVASFTWQTQAESTNIGLALLALIPLVAGSLIGTLLFPLATARTYRRTALATISIAALVSPAL